MRVLWTQLTLKPKAPRKFEVVGSNGGLLLDGETYVPVDCHYHFPAEHALPSQHDGFGPRATDTRHAGEVHVVHIHERDVPNAEVGQLDWHRIAVLGILLDSKRGADPYGLITHSDNAFAGDSPKEEKEKEKEDVVVTIGSLLPVDRMAIRYPGSLTTPPYSENVTFGVFTTPVQVSSAQFAASPLKNSLCLQAVNRRYLVRGRVDSGITG